MSQPSLFPPPEEINPPAKCPDCGQPVRRLNFIAAECVSCTYTWRRDSQLHHSEALPF